jgi:hypothetical protein
VTVGSTPMQTNSEAWGPKQAEKAERYNRRFLFQWGEQFGKSGIKFGSYVFDGGVVYVYSRFDPITRLPDLSDSVAFWQST